MATHIKDLIEDFFKKNQKEFQKKQNIEKILWENLDQETRKHIKLHQMVKNQIVLLADSSSAVYNFNLQKEDILKKIKNKYKQIKKIKVNLG